jgi:hypothetical protein
MATFFYGASYLLFVPEMGWASFWATFAPTHLVKFIKLTDVE